MLILSDTFEQFAQPLMKKLNWPTLFCNTLEVAPSGEITGFQMRCPQSKLTTVKAFSPAASRPSPPGTASTTWA